MRFALLIAVLLAAADRAGAGQPTAGLEVDQAHLDLGRVTAGSTVSATFVLHNRGTSPVRILRAAPS
jgi:hypothetical protein